MRTIFILLDSLNRRYLPAYGNEWVKTPGIDSLAARGLVFENHYCASMPCIPARRDLMTGRANFLEATWGPLEPWDDLLPDLLRQAKGTYSHLITDHCHYFNGGAGDRYQNVFDSWEYFRGQAWDPWRGVVEPRQLPEGAHVYCYGKRYLHQHLANLEYRDSQRDESYPSVQCIDAAIEFLNRNHEADNWHLHLEVFDPHEPFDCPTRYLAEYGDTWTGPPLSCPEYRRFDDANDTPEYVEHLRKAYAGTLTMSDRGLAKLFEAMDRHDMWRDTVVILTSDHGYLLGEHRWWAKNIPQAFQELVNIPLIIHHPDIAAPGRRSALTSAVDIAPTILAAHGVTEIPPSMTGRSLTGLLAEDGEHHEAVLYGYFAREVNMTDGRYTYHRAAAKEAVVHRHFTSYRGLKAEQIAGAEFGTHLKWCKGMGHFRIAQESARSSDLPSDRVIYDLHTDPGQERPIEDQSLDARLGELMKRQLERAAAPECQFVRLGLRDE